MSGNMTSNDSIVDGQSKSGLTMTVNATNFPVETRSISDDRTDKVIPPVMCSPDCALGEKHKQSSGPCKVKRVQSW